MAIVNSFVLYTLCHQEKKIIQKEYRLLLAEALVVDHVNERATVGISPGRKSNSSENRLKGKHFSVETTKTTFRGKLH